MLNGLTALWDIIELIMKMIIAAYYIGLLILGLVIILLFIIPLISLIIFIKNKISWWKAFIPIINVYEIIKIIKNKRRDK